MSRAPDVIVVGGGLSGGLFALRLSLARPDFRIVVIENRARLGRGVAYGACSPHHLLNVPVSRMEVGLRPSFADWLTQRAPDEPELIAALAESGGAIADAFAPRALFGAYLEERIGVPEVLAQQHEGWQASRHAAFCRVHEEMCLPFARPAGNEKDRIVREAGLVARGELGEAVGASGDLPHYSSETVVFGAVVKGPARLA